MFKPCKANNHMRCIITYADHIIEQIHIEVAKKFLANQLGEMAINFSFNLRCQANLYKQEGNGPIDFGRQGPYKI